MTLTLICKGLFRQEAVANDTVYKEILFSGPATNRFVEPTKEVVEVITWGTVIDWFFLWGTNCKKRPVVITSYGSDPTACAWYATGQRSSRRNYTIDSGYDYDTSRLQHIVIRSCPFVVRSVAPNMVGASDAISAYVQEAWLVLRNDDVQTKDYIASVYMGFRVISGHYIHVQRPAIYSNLN